MSKVDIMVAMSILVSYKFSSNLVKAHENILGGIC